MARGVRSTCREQDAKVASQKDGTLLCMLDSGPLKEEFQHGKKAIVDRLNEHLGRTVVRQVRIL